MRHGSRNGLPLALVYKNKYEENKFYKVKRIEIATTAVYFGMNSSHKDGTCDDYFHMKEQWVR